MDQPTENKYYNQLRGTCRAKQLIKRARKHIVAQGCRDNYHLAEPNLYMRSVYTHRLQLKLLSCTRALKQIRQSFIAHPMVRRPVSKRALASITAKQLVSKALQVRKQYVGNLLRCIRPIRALRLQTLEQFHMGQHTQSAEPYFGDSCYNLITSCRPIAVAEDGKCMLPGVAHTSLKQSKKLHAASWNCSTACKRLSCSDIQTIVDLRRRFDEPINAVRKCLATCDDGCPNHHYTKVAADGSSVMLKGHPLICSLDSGCASSLRILRAASAHSPILRRFLALLEKARENHTSISNIDTALERGDFASLMSTTHHTDFDSVLSHDITTHHKGSAVSDGPSHLNLLTTYERIITSYEKLITDYAEHPCISCQQLHRRSRVSEVKLTQKLGVKVWPRLIQFHRQSQHGIPDSPLFMCAYCKPMIRADKIPPRCVLNELHLPQVPPELAKLDYLSKQFIQRAKAYQTVVRLGTYTGKVPSYNSLKACKGSMFFLPLPLHKTLETLEEVNDDHVPHDIALPNPEVYIIVNGKPTKQKVVWRSLVNVTDIHAAITWLKENNWLYKNVQSESLDDAARAVIEVVANTESAMLSKATAEDVAGFQCYTIRNLDNKLSTEPDIDQYMLLNVKENPLDSRQTHLDAMCFPALFPDGKFGKYHPREVKLSHSEYIKTRLLNKDSRFRKDPQYVFYLLWNKELREVSSGVYNVLKTSKSSIPMSVSSLLQKVGSNDQHLEANLNTVLQSVRGTKQYWWVRRSELQCMVRNYGTPTLFLTFSCSEYNSPDITEYLMKVNDVPQSYNIPKLCTEDPISVSRQFSAKFHAFFKTVILHGEVLGHIDHYYWKKEYQARGAPHYHVLLWVRDAPIIGVHEPDKVISWIDERISCRVPNEKSNPELHDIVTKYQMHKCSGYCKCRRKRGNTFLTVCKFNFPRECCDSTTLYCVEEKLKARKKIYSLKRTQSEVRINDYNPLLLLLWKANMDIQFVSESSLALASYLTGYVTKAERSHMNDIWGEISDSKDIYSRLFTFGLRALRSRECGLYEASDLLLGDHLSEKSVSVKYIDVSMPHKRSRKLKKHSTLEKMAETAPESEDIFEDNLFNTFYPNRPSHLSGVCLHDFVAQYDYYGKDKNGNRNYRKLCKPRLVNHRLFDPQKEDQREPYYYSLLVLFVPFRHHNELLGEDETAEEAFQRLVSHNTDVSNYHATLQKMLKVRSTITAINKSRKEDPLVEKSSTEDNEPQLLGEAKSAMQDLQDLNVQPPDQLSLEERESMLNADQRRVFYNVKSQLLHQQQHETNNCDCNNIKPLQMFVSGVGGTGKSFLIAAIKALVESLWPTEDLSCAIAAPTGLAAFNVGGVTMHRLFQLPVEHDSKTAGYWALSKDAQKVMRTMLRSVKMIIIDEVSMVSSLNLVYMHMRLEELFGGNDWFGSRNMLFLGDLLQLQPVNGTAVFDKITRKTLLNKLGCATAINIWKDCVTYDELTINERQKQDGGFSTLLNSIRCGCPTDEDFSMLQERVVEGTILQKFRELEGCNKNPVCLFPTRKACEQFNHEMLATLDSPLHELLCVDEVDETKSTCKWHRKAADHLQKLNADCNNTAGLEAKLLLAVGARVMLRRNIDTKTGLVNGAIGTVLAIADGHISVHFDHLHEPFNVCKVKSKFVVMKNYFVYRQQFPLILAYAITIHKCQGLSLDCAIVDLSDRVFASGMAYVAMSRVRSLLGLHLLEFHPSAIKVDSSCLQEFNRLRVAYRKDLTLYSVPTITYKRKLTGVITGDTTSRKKARTTPKKQTSRAKPTAKSTSPLAKKNKTKTQPPATRRKLLDSLKKQTSDAPLILGATAPQQGVLHFHSVGELWQRETCKRLNLNFVAPNGVNPGGPRVPLTPPDQTLETAGDGNCMFRSFAHILTGSQDQHVAVRSAIMQHMLHKSAHLMIKHLPQYSSIQDYIRLTHMDRQDTWGTLTEILALSELLNTPICTYDTQAMRWQRFSPHQVNRALSNDPSAKAMYLNHPQAHYNVVLTTLTSGNIDVIAQSTHSHSQLDAPQAFFPVDEQWQRHHCAQLHLNFLCASYPHNVGGPNVPLTAPRASQTILGDGNCLFRCLSYILTGTQRQHMAVRRALLDYMGRIEAMLADNFLLNYDSLDDYVQTTNMHMSGTWGTEVEVMMLASLLCTRIYLYRDYCPWHENHPELFGGQATAVGAIYLSHLNGNHFNVVVSV